MTRWEVTEGGYGLPWPIFGTFGPKGAVGKWPQWTHTLLLARSVVRAGWCIHPPKEAAMSERPIGPQTGDLARRVTERRVELGLSQKEVAHRACMSWDYFEY